MGKRSERSESGGEEEGMKRVWHVNSVSNLERFFDRCRDTEAVVYTQLSQCCWAPFVFEYAMGRHRIIFSCSKCNRVDVSIAVPERDTAPTTNAETSSDT
jgi:hypothetical protein